MAIVSKVGEGEIWTTGGILQPVTDCVGAGSCSGMLFEGSPWIFVILTVIIGGGCAIMAGRSVARGWGPASVSVVYGLLLAAAVRFLHFGLLRGTLVSPYYYLIDAIVLVGLALAGYWYTRSAQMARQYPWKFRRNGPFGWTSI